MTSLIQIVLEAIAAAPYIVFILASRLFTDWFFIMTDSKSPKPRFRASHATFTKKQLSTKTSDIYERFLNRVQQIENDPAKNNKDNKDHGALDSNQPSRAEDDGLDFDLDFTLPADLTKTAANSNTDNDAGFSSVIEDPTDDDDLGYDLGDAPLKAPTEPKIKAADHDEAEDDLEQKKVSSAKATKTLKQKKANLHVAPSRAKTLAVGIICGLVISGSVIAILNSLGIIALTPEPAAKTADTLPNHPKPAVEPQSQSGDLKKGSADLKNTATDPITPPTESKPIAATTKPAPTDQQNRQLKNSQLSYQDFAEEAGTTIYRETN